MIVPGKQILREPHLCALCWKCVETASPVTMVSSLQSEVSVTFKSDPWSLAPLIETCTLFFVVRLNVFAFYLI